MSAIAWCVCRGHVVADNPPKPFCCRSQSLVAGLLVRVEIEAERGRRRRIAVGLDLVEQMKNALARTVAAEDRFAAQQPRMRSSSSFVTSVLRADRSSLRRATRTADR
jgi:hypothetical protein